ncbi:site-specific integrase [Sediminicoccus sp. KRV36]|uniref:tyrosine-type recombinase/integrase n=1 Tax=Sediminicoccus sp. KRV36 TaxID=3133721 RepID=UPI00204C9BBB|nr:site-specific integrase [Sediminicoccus rosea]UPY35431.1 site-specific integrase [Sediminicoccus rosea]
MPKFTDGFIEAFKPMDGAKDRLAFDTECKGLGVRVTRISARQDGAEQFNRIFLVQWTDTATGRRVREPLGVWGALTIKQAREAAKIRLGRLAAGFDPKAEREARKAEDDQKRQDAARAKIEAQFTLEKLIEDWAKLHLASRRPRYAAEAERALRVTFAAHLKSPARRLDHEAVIAALDALAGDGKAAMAGRTMAYGRACYGWAVKRRRLALNPFAGLPAIEGGNPARDRVLTDAEVGEVWRAAEGLGQPFGPIIRLGLLTAQRREEVAAMRWSELAADGASWNLPNRRAKNGRAHIIHLSEAARAVLASVVRIEGQDLIFTTTGKTAPSGFSRAKRALDAAIMDARIKAGACGDQPEGEGWRLHDFRRTAVTWMAGAGFPPHVADKILNHVQGTISGVAAVYQKQEFLAERKAALEAWGAHVVICGEGKAKDAKVASLSEARARKGAA